MKSFQQKRDPSYSSAVVNGAGKQTYQGLMTQSMLYSKYYWI
jgi:hypothetical protein